MEHSFDIDLAKKYGILEAILLKNLWFWIKKNEANEKNFFDGTYWTYNSTKAFNELFPYASESTIKRTLKKLQDLGLIKTGNYNEVAYDRTLWYAFKPLGIAIMSNRTMDDVKSYNGMIQNDQPIPYNKPYNKPYIINKLEIKEKNKINYDEFKEVYNQYCSNLPKVSLLNDKRKSLIKKYLAEYSIEDFKNVCKFANQDNFLIGNNTSKWKANFDYLIRIDKSTRILENNAELINKEKEDNQNKKVYYNIDKLSKNERDKLKKKEITIEELLKQGKVSVIE